MRYYSNLKVELESSFILLCVQKFGQWDILKPDLIWIEGRCYRLNIQNSFLRGEEDRHFADDVFEEEISECPVEEPCDYTEIETIENGRYRTSLRVARFYFPHVIGHNGTMRLRLENETRTQICVPKQGQDGYIVITGSSRSGVSAAKRRINLIVISARQKQQFTHFLSIPLVADPIKERFMEFRDKVLDICKNSRGVDASIFQAPGKLHLTLGTMVIMDNDEREEAVQTLAECKESIIEPLLQNRPLVVCMAGVEYMNDDPAEVDVLYGKVYVKDGHHVLQEVADGVINYFSSKGLMQKQYEQVKLHVTLMNTRFRNDSSGDSESSTSRWKRTPRESFDATSILKNFEDYDFGQQTVNSIHLSQRFSTSATGYYQATADISFM